ncbi:MAG TPA: hypothetical protein VFU69_17425 [Ktedonobacterales bacterium]|nr:hypothetical protein [Ktedonobacterales bacterium]
MLTRRALLACNKLYTYCKVGSLGWGRCARPSIVFGLPPGRRGPAGRSASGYTARPRLSSATMGKQRNRRALFSWTMSMERENPTSHWPPAVGARLQSALGLRSQPAQAVQVEFFHR